MTSKDSSILGSNWGLRISRKPPREERLASRGPFLKGSRASQNATRASLGTVDEVIETIAGITSSSPKPWVLLLGSPSPFPAKNELRKFQVRVGSPL